MEILEEELPIEKIIQAPATTPLSFFPYNPFDRNRMNSFQGCRLPFTRLICGLIYITTALSAFTPLTFTSEKTNHSFLATALLALTTPGYFYTVYRLLNESSYYYHEGIPARNIRINLRGRNFSISLTSIFFFILLNLHGLPFVFTLSTFIKNSDAIDHLITSSAATFLLLIDIGLKSILEMANINRLYYNFRSLSCLDILKEIIYTIPFLIPAIFFGYSTINNSAAFFQFITKVAFTLPDSAAISFAIFFTLLSLPMNMFGSRQVFEDAKQLTGMSKPTVELKENKYEFAARHLSRLSYGVFKSALLYMTTSYSLPLIIAAGLVCYIQGAAPENIRLSCSRFILMAIPRRQPEPEIKEDRIEMQNLIDMKI